MPGRGQHLEAERDGFIQATAIELDEAEQRCIGLQPISRRPLGLTEDEAWRIAAARDQLRAERGEVLVGYKLGWTSEAMRRALGITEPNFGTLWNYMRVDGEHLASGRLIHPKAEPEFAFLADRALSGPDITADEVSSSGRWAVALEIVDPRWASYDFDWLDNTADGSSAAAYMVGGFHRTTVSPEHFRLTMETESPTTSRAGSGSEAMGSPAAAVVYLVKQLHARGLALQSGMVVLTGGVTAPVDLVPGLRIRVSSPELGSCLLHCDG